CYRIPYEYCSSPGDLSAQADKSLGAADPALGDLMIYFGVGNHGGGPTRANIESIHRYDRMGSFGRMVISSPGRYFDELAKRIIARTRNVIARQVDIPLEEGTQPVLVFNPHPWPVTAQVEIQYGAQPAGVHVVDGDGRPTVAQPTQSVATTDDLARGAAVF